MNQIFEFVKKNVVLVLVGLAAIILLFFPKVLRFGAPRRKHSRKYYAKQRAARSAPRIRRKNRPPLPRSVGTKGYPAAGGGYIPFKYNKDGTVKKAWQVAGTAAAKNRMSKLRRNR